MHSTVMGMPATMLKGIEARLKNVMEASIPIFDANFVANF